MNMTRSAHARRTLVIGVAASLMISALGQGTPRADESSEPITGLYIEDAVATPADVGETAIIGFRIDNFSARNVTLIRVSSSNAESSVIVMRGGGIGVHIANSLSIMQDESFDLRTSHMWVELRGLRTEIREGDLVPFELVFARGRVSAQAHAHAGAMPGVR